MLSLMSLFNLMTGSLEYDVELMKLHFELVNIYVMEEVVVHTDIIGTSVLPNNLALRVPVIGYTNNVYTIIWTVLLSMFVCNK
jgi:hypothetical protein